MKTAEIEIGQDYAVLLAAGGLPYRMRVVEKGTFKKLVYSGSRDFSGHVTEMKGIQVVSIAEDGTVREHVDATWVVSTRVVHTWAEEEEFQKARDSREASLQQSAADLKARAAALGLEYTYPDSREATITLSWSDYRKLLNLAERGNG